MTLKELFAVYRSKKLRGASPNTIRLYIHTIRAFTKTLTHEPTIDDLDDDVVENHLWAIVERGGSPASANKDRSQIIALWNFAFDRRIVERRPCVQTMKEPERVPLGWLPEELRALLDAADNCPKNVGNVPGPVFWGALVRTILDTGERIGAVRSLPRNAIQGRYLLVAANTRKGKTRDRLFPLNEDTIEANKRLLDSHREELLYHWPYSPTYLYDHYNAILAAANLPTDRQSKFHRIRRTVASAVARAGGDPTAALDHASPRTTKKYLDPRIVGGVEVSSIVVNYLGVDSIG